MQTNLDMKENLFIRALQLMDLSEALIQIMVSLWKNLSQASEIEMKSLLGLSKKEMSTELTLAKILQLKRN